MPIAPVIGSALFEFHQRVQPISATGQKILDPNVNRNRVVLHNVGTVPVQVFYNADGAGDPILVLPGGTALDSGTSPIWVENDWQGAVFLKAPAGGGNVLVSAF